MRDVIPKANFPEFGAEDEWGRGTTKIVSNPRVRSLGRVRYVEENSRKEADPVDFQTGSASW